MRASWEGSLHRSRALFVLVTMVISWSAAPAQYDTTEWKEFVAAGHLPYRALSAGDFPISNRDYPEPIWVNPFLAYRYDHDQQICDSEVCVSVSNWRVYSGFDKSSGRKSGFDETVQTLPFLQGVLDIHELYCRRLAAIPPSNLPTGRGRAAESALEDLNRQLDKLSDQTLRVIDDEIRRYMAETRGGKDEKELQRWRAKLSARLKEAGIVDRVIRTQ
jgi:hypothetical protein